MRTTVTLDPDVYALLRRRMDERHVSFEQAVNEAVRDGLLVEREATPFETPTFDLGGARVPLERALESAGQLEDAALLRKRARDE